MQAIDIDIAQHYFEEKEGIKIPRRKIHPKIDKILREFILNGGGEEWIDLENKLDMVEEKLEYGFNAESIEGIG